MRFKNLAPFAFGYKTCSRKPPQPELVAIVRGKFKLVPGQPLTRGGHHRGAQRGR
jgi:hypothetical protein